MQTRQPGRLAVETVPVVSSQKYLTLCFVFPAVILGTVFALHGVYPFGNRQILIHDFFQQYYPFLSNLWHKVRAGTVSPWSWTAGGGHDYAAFIAYYMASPLNLLLLILPHAWLREALTLILLVRIGCAGLFTGVFLRGGAFRQDSPVQAGGLALPFFSSLYALCAFTLGYYWNIMWFDTFALLPLVALGVLRLVNEGKYRLYTVSLALSVFTNFYMGIFVCIFTALAFFGLCFIQKCKARDFLRRLGLIAGCSVLALGMAAVVLLPSWSALQNIYGAETAFPAKPALYNSFFNILGNFIAFTPPTNKEGLPNLYCGMISVLLAGLYIYSAKVSRREKLVFAATFVFLLISCNLNVLDYIMHGFRYPNMIPSRFSFLISFILAVIAYRGFLLTEDMNRRGLPAMGASAAVFLLAAVFGSQGKGYVTGSVVLCVFYLLIFYIFTVVKTARGRAAVRIAFFALVLTELSITSYIAIETVTLTGRDGYPDSHRQIRALLDMRQPTGGTDFYRTDIDKFYTFNDPSLYNYNGISFFSTTANDGVTRFMHGLGVSSGGPGNNVITYNKVPPLINAFLNMRYVISRESSPAADDIYWQTAGKTGGMLLQENKRYLPLGFMVNEDITGYKRHDGNPFLSQNDLFRRATGLNAGLFTVAELNVDTPAMKFDEENISVWDYKMPSDGILYAYCRNDTLNGMAAILINGDLFQQFRIYKSMPYILTAGSFSQDDIISFVTENNTLTYTGLLNADIFERGYALLADGTLRLTQFTDTKVSGNVRALKDGVLYTSIPGDKNWNVFVDGVKSEIVLIDNAMAAVRLKEGSHTVEFRYFNKSLAAGIIVSLASLAVFAALVLVQNRRPCRPKN